MLEIALEKTHHGVLQKDIAINQDISVKYLDYIIHTLKVAGLIINVKGKKSGYVLTRKPSEITMYDIHTAFEPELCIVDCLTPGMICTRSKKCAVRGFWVKLNSLIINYLRNTTLKDIIEQDQLLKTFNLPAKNLY